MKSRIILLGLLCCALALPLAYTLAAPAAEQAEVQSKRAPWQHLALPHEGTGLDAELSRQINRLGDEGWQLVGVTPIAKDGTTVQTVYYFKRLK